MNPYRKAEAWYTLLQSSGTNQNHVPLEGMQGENQNHSHEVPLQCNVNLIMKKKDTTQTE